LPQITIDLISIFTILIPKEKFCLYLDQSFDPAFVGLCKNNDYCVDIRFQRIEFD